MKKIISLSAYKQNWKMGIDQAAAKDLFAKGVAKATGESPSHRKSHLPQPVNPYETIQILKRIIKLQGQGIDLLTQELSEVKR